MAGDKSRARIGMDELGGFNGYVRHDELGNISYPNHGYVHDTWSAQLVRDGLKVKPGMEGYSPSSHWDLYKVGGFTDPVEKCAFDDQAGRAIDDLREAFIGLRDALRPFQYDSTYDGWAVYDNWATISVPATSCEAAGALNQVLVGFEGYFADIFRKNKAICVKDGMELFSRADKLIGLASRMRDAAWNEQKRRDAAKEVFWAHWDWWKDHKQWEIEYDNYDDSIVCDMYGDFSASVPYPDREEPTPREEAKINLDTMPPYDFPDSIAGLGEPNGGREDLSGVGSSGTTTTSGVPENLRAWGVWWRAHRESVLSALARVVEAYIDGRFHEAAVQSGAFEDEGGAEAVGKPMGSPGWKWGQIVGLFDGDGGGFLGAVKQFCDANDIEALSLDCIADCFAWADSVGIKELEHNAIQEKLDDLYARYDALDGTIDGTLGGVKLGYGRSHVKGVGDLGFGGVQPSSGYAYDPVNVATGALMEVEEDIAFAGATASFGLTRVFNAGDKSGGVFGAGWFSVLDEHLEVSPSEVLWRRVDGALVSFDANPAAAVGVETVGAVSQPYWLSCEDLPVVFRGLSGLADVDGHVLCVSDNAGALRVFDREGTLIGFTGGGPGDGVVCERDDQGRIVRLVHASGRHIECEYTSGFFISRVASSDGREVVYSYVENRLVSVAGPRGVRGYVWDEESGGLARTVDESGVVLMENTFDKYGRVRTQKTPAGRTAEFIYLPSGVCVVRDADTKDDEHADRWVSDKDARLVGVVDSHGAKMSISRDRFGNPVSVVDREGRETLRVFDNRSRLTRQVSPEGVRTSMEWDEWDRPTRIVRSIPALDNGEAIVEETILVYRDPVDTDGVVVRSPVSVTDSEGVAYTFEHDEQGRTTALCGAEGYRVAFEYDEVTGDLKSITNALDQTVNFTYDATGNISSMTSPSGALTQFEWDNAGHMVKRIDPDGVEYCYGYENDRLVSEIAPDGGKTTYTYGKNGKRVSTTDSLGRTTEFTHDDQGNTATTTLPSGDTWTTVHDSMSRLNKVLSPTGDEWAYGYTVNGELESIAGPTGLITSLAKTFFEGGTQVETILSTSLNSNADVTQEARSNTVTLDGLGRPVKVCSPDGTVLETRVYDKVGRVKEVLDGEAGLTRYEYNSLGLLSRIINPDETVTDFVYDKGVRLVEKSSSSGVREEYSYDDDGRIVRIANQDGEEQVFTYDVCGRRTSLTTTTETVSGFTTTTVSYSYDVCGRLASITDSLHGTHTFTYDVAGQVVSVTDANENSTAYTYTANGQVETVTSPDGGVTRFEYDCYGKMTRKTDPLGRSETRTYDPIGNLTSLTRADKTGLSHEYDAAGRLLSLKNHKGEVLASYNYNISDRTVTITDSLAGTKHSLVFDCLGRLSKKTTGDATVVYTYGKNGKRESVAITRVGEEQPVTISYEYAPMGKLQEVTHSTFGTLTSSSARVSEAGVVISRDEAGRISRIVTDGSDVSYEYDGAGQLAVLTNNQTQETSAYAYDACGRLTAITSSAGETLFTYNQASELVSRVMPDGTTITYAYDSCGRRVSETLNGNITRSFEWDNLGYLAHLTRHNATPSLRGEGETFDEAINTPTNTISLTHDVFGNLASLIDGEETTRFLWDDAGSVPSLLQTGDSDVFTALGHTAYGTAQTNTGWVNHGWRSVRPTAPDNPWALPSVLSSLRGSEVTEAISLGEAKQSQVASPWNILLGGSVSMFGLELMGARTYDPFTHGFLSTDPLPPVPGTPYAGNPYEYAGNNPLALFDPLGLRALTDAEFAEMAETYNKNYQASHESWWDSNGAYVVGYTLMALAVVGSIVLTVATFGAGAPVAAGTLAWAGAAIGGSFAAGNSIVSQKETNGNVDVGQVLIDGTVGAVFGAAGGYAGAAVGPAVGGNFFDQAVASYGVNLLENVGGNMTAEFIKDKAYDDYAEDYDKVFKYSLMQTGLEAPVGARSAPQLATAVVIANPPNVIAFLASDDEVPPYDESTVPFTPVPSDVAPVVVGLE